MNGETPTGETLTGNENDAVEKVQPKKGKERAGFTKNHGLGVKKSVRKMVAASKKQNRGKK